MSGRVVLAGAEEDAVVELLSVPVAEGAASVEAVVPLVTAVFDDTSVGSGEAAVEETDAGSVEAGSATSLTLEDVSSVRSSSEIGAARALLKRSTVASTDNNGFRIAR